MFLFPTPKLFKSIKSMKRIISFTLQQLSRRAFAFWLCLAGLLMTAQPTQATLLLKYNFDEASGNALDTSGTGIAANATFFNLATRTTNTPGGTGKALDVTAAGSNYVFAVTGTNKLNVALTNLTLTTWINLQGNITGGDRIMGNVTASSGFDFAFPTVPGTANAAQLTFRKNTTGGGFPATAPVNLTNQWVFVALVYDGANVSYYTGTVANAVGQLGTSVVYTGGGTVAASTANFQVGATPATTADRTPPAWFDDVRVYDTALTSGQLETIRQSVIPTGVAPSVTLQPVSQTIYTSGNPTFTAGVSGDLPMLRQWYRNGTNVGNIITGATNLSLTLTNVSLSDNGSTYSLLASNSFGKAWSSNAILSVVGVQITSQPTPTNQTLLAESTALFSAVANGASPLVYQWYYLGTNNAFTNAVVGATNATLALAKITANSVGNYALFVTNAFGSVWSSNVTLAAVLPLFNTAQATNLWTLPLGSRSYLSTNTILNLERGLAFNPATTNLLLASRDQVSGFNVVSLNPLTGAENYFLNTNGISGGTFPINMIRAANDGAVYAANLTTAANTTAYRVYRWSDDNSATVPTLSFAGDPGFGVAPGLRWGDNLALRGAGNDTQILLASATGTNVALLTTADGGLSFTSQIIPVSSVESGFAQYGLSFGPGTNTFWAKNRGTNLYLVTFDINTLTGSPAFTYSNTPFLFRAIAADSSNRWLAGVANESPDTMRLFDVSALTNPPVLADQEILGTAKGLTDATVPADSTFWANQYVFTLDPFNGISAFSIDNSFVLVTASTNANLASLVLNPGTFTPSFSSGVTSYAGTNYLPNNSVTLTAVVADTNATLQLSFNGGAYGSLTSAIASGFLTLTQGTPNVLKVRVTAQDTVTTNLYTLNVTLQPKQSSPPTLTSGVSSSTLNLSWGADYQGYRLQVQTNNLNTGLSSNWVTVPGSTAVTATNIIISPSKACEFYRLVYP